MSDPYYRSDLARAAFGDEQLPKGLVVLAGTRSSGVAPVEASIRR